ncbi:MAG TPA: glycoside hydrolase family 3 protein [Micromonosporaceae bacterium]
MLGAFHGPVAPDWAHQLIAAGIGGYVLFGSNVVEPDQLASLCSSLHSVRPDALLSIDEEGGDVTRLWHAGGSPYPGNGALGAIDDPELTGAIYAALGAELARVGIDLNLAPTVDVNSSVENPVIGTRSFGSDPALVARHSAAAVIGLQEAGVAACAKHFPGHGATTADSHLELPTVDATPDLLAARDLPPFEAAAAAGSQAIMTAHIRIPSLTGDAPATFSPAALSLLRERIGFEGCIITDALEMQGAARFAGGHAAGAVLALMAGADLLCIGSRVTAEDVEATVAAVIDAVNDGRLPLTRLEQASERVARLAAWVSSHQVPGRPIDSDIGLIAARRAITIAGTLPDLSGALIVQLDATATIAEGRVPWGLAPLLPTVVRAVSTIAPSELPDAGPIVISGRSLHRLPGATTLIDTLGESHDVVVVEMGTPSPERPSKARAIVTTHGASRANSIAAAEALGIL